MDFAEDLFSFNLRLKHFQEQVFSADSKFDQTRLNVKYLRLTIEIFGTKLILLKLQSTKSIVQNMKKGFPPIINKFLCRFDLTTGGRWISLLTFYGSIVFIILNTICMVIVYMQGCEEIKNLLLIYGMKMSEKCLKICDIGISRKLNLNLKM